MGVVNDIVADTAEDGPTYFTPAPCADDYEFSRLPFRQVDDDLACYARLHGEATPDLANDSHNNDLAILF